MPGMKTHDIFGQEMIRRKNIDQEAACILQYPGAYHMGLQGPDLFFYSPSPWLFYKKNIGNIMHHDSTGAFFKNLLEVRDRLPEAQQPIADAYICGFMGHYTLDCICHPYIYYRTNHLLHEHERRGNYDFGLHVFLEADIDSACVRQYLREDPCDMKMEEVLSMSAQEKRAVCRLLHEAILRTYPGRAIRRRHITQSFTTICIAAKLLRDPLGWKKKVVRFVEQRSLGYPIISGMLIDPKVQKYPDPCNLTHRKWCNPWDKTYTFTGDSIPDLMTQACDVLEKRIQLLISYTQKAAEGNPSAANEDRIALLEDLGNRSYNTGYDLQVVLE